ncbi:hypothetical protein WA026_003053 [Henosepilachna vigintioctopunctata]|uniref:Lipocalin/cytosolic fatty-acid binding domain-containing protein n=1 Tax=Henosepilachna vigintioctopunctata TaxID=420089 RepID=A0AAW1TMB7_9CUCU
MFQYVTVFALFLCGINSQIIRPGKCPDVPVQENFNLIEFGGVWYEAERTPIGFEDGGSCTKHSLTPLSNVKLHVLISQLLRESGQTRLIDGTATLNDKPDEAKFTVNLNLGPESRPTPYFALEVDYNEYASVWSCSQVNENTYAEFAIVLARSRNPSEETLNKARNVYDRNNISRKEFQKVDQNNC